MEANDLILILAACIVLALPVCFLVFGFLVICEDLLWRLAGLWVRVMTGLSKYRE